jgi:hypothetical protein
VFPVSEGCAIFPSPRFFVICPVVRMRAREVLKGDKGGREVLKDTRGRGIFWYWRYWY